MQFARAAKEDPDVIKELDSVILVKIHNKRGTDVALLETYKVRGYPTFVLENIEGETLHRWWGYNKEGFLTEIQYALSDPTTITEKIARYKKSPDIKTALALASNYSTLGEPTKVVAYYSDAAELNPDNDYAYELYNAYRRGFGHPYSENEIIRATDIALASKYVDASHKLRIYDEMGTAIVKQRGNTTILDYIKGGQEYAKNISDKNLQYLKDRINIVYVLYIDGNIDEAVNLKKNTFQDGWMDNARNLNSFSWWCFEHQINLEEAEKLARKGIKLAKPGSQKASILDTVAEIVFLKGDKDEALKLIRESIQENPENDYYQNQLSRFQEELVSESHK